MNTIEFFGITTELATANEVILTMPITDKTKQPYGVVHGGINAMLAETAASIGGNAAINDAHRAAVGVDLEIHHLNAVTEGTLKAVATPIHVGHRLQTWQVNLYETTTETHVAVSIVTLTSRTI
ncbi:hotdog fold thioesterase [Weissella viridescens]|uniref:Hotdog fold thioesterase n=1 Tax=Weissella viridescens TaxID=1629 RepID=A0A3P2RCL5_WEIVI|nr:hotdog fold thioesterase [Weissella viridescens]RRG18479.1 hotdog fold thioesterase [Weissella viridescens]